MVLSRSCPVVSLSVKVELRAERGVKQRTRSVAVSRCNSAVYSQQLNVSVALCVDVLSTVVHISSVAVVALHFTKLSAAACRILPLRLSRDAFITTLCLKNAEVLLRK